MPKLPRRVLQKVKKSQSKKHTVTYWNNQLDPLMSKLCRSKAYCERCNRRGDWKFDWAHIIGRSNRTLRWDIMNCLCLCFVCHKWWHENPTESGIWFANKYPDRNAYLNKAKLIITKRTEEDYVALKGYILNKEVEKLHLPIELLKD